MLETLNRSWALLLGVMLLMVGNGIQGTLLGVRGEIEGFSTYQMSLVMSAYFAGYLGGARYVPDLIQRVGHVRVFAALASFVSAILILFPVAANPWAWVVLRFLIGFCFSGVYVTAESWLNHAASNENRGKAFSLYMIVQALGVVIGQGMLLLADPSGFAVFVIPSVLVSIAFAPILLSISPTPAFASAKPMSLRELYRISPLGCVGIFLVGALYSTMIGMAAVYAAAAGFSLMQISAFVASMYVGGVVFQYPIGYISDRMDRRKLVVAMAALGVLASVLGMAFLTFEVILTSGFMIGAVTNALYALLNAYTNDHLQPEDMPAASGRLLFLTGSGAIGGPLVTGWLMSVFGPPGYFVFLALLLGTLTVYTVYRTTRRPAPSRPASGSYTPVLPSSSHVALAAVLENYVEATEADASKSAAIREQTP